MHLNDEELNRIIAELESAVSREGAKVQIFSEGDGNEGGLVANRAGYLRLGVEMLKTAIAPPIKSSSHLIGTDLSYLLDQGGSAFYIGWFERKESIDPICTVSSMTGKFILYSILVALLASVGLAVVGLVTVIRWIF